MSFTQRLYRQEISLNYTYKHAQGEVRSRLRARQSTWSSAPRGRFTANTRSRSGLHVEVGAGAMSQLMQQQMQSPATGTCCLRKGSMLERMLTTAVCAQSGRGRIRASTSPVRVQTSGELAPSRSMPKSLTTARRGSRMCVDVVPHAAPAVKKPARAQPDAGF